MNAHELGYYFHPSTHPGHPGHPKLEINVVAVPEHKHYDTRQVSATMAAFGGVQPLQIHHPWHTSEYRVCAGRIELLDFVNKPVDVFTFGGQLVTTEFDDRTQCVLSSNAPIIWLMEEELPSTVIAEECESLLARRHAEWLAQLPDYEAKLIKADPLELYIACLNEIEHICDHEPRGCNEGLRLAARAAKHALQDEGLWPAYQKTLTQIL